MKKFLVASLVVVFALTGFAQQEESMQEPKKMQELAFELLREKIESNSVNVVGLQKDENIRDIISDILTPIMDALSFSDGDNDRELLELDCKKTDLAAVCSIVGALYVPEGGIDLDAKYSLSSTPAIKTTVQFVVSLDANEKPVSILENRVTVVRVKLNGAK